MSGDIEIYGQLLRIRNLLFSSSPKTCEPVQKSHHSFR